MQTQPHLPPNINTYHCLCNSFLLASTHKLTALPRRAPPCLDNSIILPLPSSPPVFSSPGPDSSDEDGTTEPPPASTSPSQEDLPAEGYSLLLGMSHDRKPVVVRREDGFERRVCWRCNRCRLVVGYEVEGEDQENRTEKDSGKVVYLLPGGILSTEVMAGKKRIEEGEVEMGKGAGVWE